MADLLQSDYYPYTDDETMEVSNGLNYRAITKHNVLVWSTLLIIITSKFGIVPVHGISPDTCSICVNYNSLSSSKLKAVILDLTKMTFNVTTVMLAILIKK